MWGLTEDEPGFGSRAATGTHRESHACLSLRERGVSLGDTVFIGKACAENKGPTWRWKQSLETRSDVGFLGVRPGVLGKAFIISVCGAIRN